MINYTYVFTDYTDGRYSLREANDKERVLVRCVPIPTEVWEKYSSFKKEDIFWQGVISLIDNTAELRVEQMT